MDRTGKTSIFDHGKVRLAKRRKCSDNLWHTPSLDPLRATGARAERRAPRGSPRGSPVARGLTFRTSDHPSQAYYVAQTAPAEFKVRRAP